MGRLVVATLLVTGTAHAQEQDIQGKRWAVGLQASPTDAPRGHLGIPIAGTEDGFHLAAALVSRYQLSDALALNAGAGLPSSAMGPSVWGGFEVFARVVADRRRVVALELYEDSGLQLGFAGPDYYARRDNDFPGYGYAFGGDVSFAVRLPVGARLCWIQNRFDTFVEGTSIVALTPAVETFFDVAVGARVHF
jgi:hypothetical protein